jgi:biopolymer transport protein ExbD
MAKLKRPNMTPPEISQASTADIAFLLLIFFISTTVFETEFGMQVVLPGMGGTPMKVKRENVLTLRAAADGSVFLDDSPVALPTVRTLIEEQLDANPDLTISIETDGSAAYERMIDVLDEVKAAKAQRFSIKKGRG